MCPCAAALFVERRCAGFRRERVEGKGRTVILREFEGLGGDIERREGMVSDHGTFCSSALCWCDLRGEEGTDTDMNNRRSNPINTAIHPPQHTLHAHIPHHRPSTCQRHPRPNHLHPTILPSIRRRRSSTHGSQAQYRRARATARQRAVFRPKTAVRAIHVLEPRAVYGVTGWIAAVGDSECGD